MFGHRYFGSRYFGARYFGPSDSVLTPAQSLRFNALLIDPDTLYTPFVGLGEPPQYLPPNVDMRTGFRAAPGELIREWTGLMVTRHSIDQRNPQDFVRGRKERIRVPGANPEPADVFVDVGDVDRSDF